MSRMNLTQADQLFVGKVRYAKAQHNKPGIEMTPLYDYRSAPALAVSTDIAASQAITAGTPALINGARATAGIATLDVPRNVVAAWTTASVMTIVGTDQYGETISEVSASGTSHTGKKAFKTITSINMSISVTAFTAGSGAVVGLPYRVDANDLLAARFNNAIDAGTFLPADLTKPATGSTGDTRGTFAAAGTFDGVKVLSLLIKVAGVIGAGGLTAKEMAYGVQVA